MPAAALHTQEDETTQTHQDEATNSNKLHEKSETGAVISAQSNALENDDDYDEEEDEDYNLETAKQDNGPSGDDEDDDGQDDYMDVEEKKVLAKYSAIESTEGGLIKTRRQRQEEEEREKKQKKTNNSTKQASTTDINSIWEEMKSLKSSSPTHKDDRKVVENTLSEGASSDKPNEKIKITRTYEFAGKQITEEKEVDIDSEEAKAHLNSVKIKANNEAKPEIKQSNPTLRRKRKRASLLEAVISNSSSTKLSTLEKSRLDWATYVDKNKISDELKYKNKGGFLEKQDFLNRVDSKRENLFKDAKTKR
ncbi:hypothetical protein CANINC_000807 [Pichia inconspicua]|uniref:SWR1-complex protein 5 n=1 Tax=Pichia inconspicua TaxID=52247 RepID=A0A4T0X5B2_9ASCO|nr:hypothetical protein CANINC_000807 [[Candida] inconspicua]